MKRLLFAACALGMLIFQNMLFPHTARASASAGEEGADMLDACALVGSTVEDLTAKYGQPDRAEPSEYSFTWYVYNRDYANFFLAGVRDGAVVAVYTNAATLSYDGRFALGSARTAVYTALGIPNAPAACSNTVCSLCVNGGKELFTAGENLVAVFYDDAGGGRVTALLILPLADEGDAVLYNTELMEGQSAALARIGKDIAKAEEARGSMDEVAGAAPAVSQAGLTERETAEALADYAKLFIGLPYEQGAAGPDSFECSGLTYYVYGQFGVTLPRKAQGQGYADYGVKIEDRADLLPGDLVFFNSDPEDEDLCDHVGIYIGKGKIVHSPAPGMQVKISSLKKAKDFSWGRRVFQ